jgi:hypothetical protein
MPIHWFRRAFLLVPAQGIVKSFEKFPPRGLPGQARLRAQVDERTTDT